jgi:hypothetical protein
MFLMNFLTSNHLQNKQLLCLFTKLAVISEALYSTTLFALFLENFSGFLEKTWRITKRLSA